MARGCGCNTPQLANRLVDSLPWAGGAAHGADHSDESVKNVGALHLKELLQLKER
jgi:hypothetical protein